MKKFVLAFTVTIFLMPLQTFSINDNIKEMINNVSEEMLYYYDYTIQNFGPHPTGSDECNAVAELIYNESRSYGLDVIYDEWRKNGLEGKNVVATLKGISNFTIIISAHYDSYPTSPGADDDGSGVACVLMAAKILSEYSFLHTIKFIAFSGEEQGLYGSEWYARNAYEREEDIIADIQLDGVGHAVSKEGGSKIRISANDASTWLTDIAENVANVYDEIGLQIIRHRNFPGSDHQSFLNYGYEGIFFLEDEFNPHYHSAQDTIEHVNISYLAKVCRLAVATLATAANEPVHIMTKIVEPERGALYVGGRKIMEIDSYNTIIFGRIHAVANVLADEKIRRVEFYFDGELRGVDEEKPYEYVYGKIAFFNHKIKAFAYGEENTDINEIEVTVYNLLPNYWLR